VIKIDRIYAGHAEGMEYMKNTYGVLVRNLKTRTPIEKLKEKKWE
jgi:hypothetical protein